jgi:hypothetical protein
MKTHIIIVLLCLALMPLMSPASALTSFPIIQGHVYLDDSSPASQVPVQITVNGLVFTTVQTDTNGFYTATLDTEFELSLPFSISSHYLNQTGSSYGTLIDGHQTTIINLQLYAPPRYNLTLTITDINTLLPVPSAFVIVNVDPYNTNTEIGNAYTNPSGIVYFILATDTYRFTAIKSGYISSAELIFTISQDSSETLSLGTPPTPSYTLSITTQNSSSHQSLSNVALTIKDSTRATTVSSGITDPNGLFTVTLPSQSYWIIGTHSNYASNETLVTLDHTLTTILQLTPHTTTPTPIFLLPILIASLLIACIIYRRH